MAKGKTDTTEDNGILRLYNQFPRNYQDIGAMTQQLPQIAAMGFNAVWVNPLYETGTTPKKICGEAALGKPYNIRPESDQCGSLYGMKDNAVLNPAFSECKEVQGQARKIMDKASIQRYTATARGCGLTPMFDLVLKHVSVDSPLVGNGSFEKRVDILLDAVFPEGQEAVQKDETLAGINKVLLIPEQPEGQLEFSLDRKEFKTQLTDRIAKRYPGEPNQMMILFMRDLQKPEIGLPDDNPFRTCQTEKPHWFKRHPSGELDIHGIDAQGTVIKRSPWDDVASFNYGDEVVRKEIIEQYWKPFIKRQIELGFTGVRVDAAGMVPEAVHDELNPYIIAECERVHEKEPIIFAETLGPLENTLKEIPRLSGNGVTHVTNSLHWAPTTIGPKREGADPHFPAHEMGTKQQMVFLDKDKKLIGDARGGTVGFVSSHDEAPWAHELQENKRKHSWIKDAKEIEKGMREKAARVAFMSDGGWYISCGDEYASEQPKNVFAPKPGENPVLWTKGAESTAKYTASQEVDLTGHIRSINSILKALPVTRFCSWCEEVTLPGKEDLVVVIRHNGEGLDGRTDIVVANKNPAGTIVLQKDDMKYIKEHSQLTRVDNIHAANGVDATRVGGRNYHQSNIWDGVERRSNLTLRAMCEPLVQDGDRGKVKSLLSQSLRIVSSMDDIAIGQGATTDIASKPKRSMSLS